MSEVFKRRGDDTFVPLGYEAVERTPVAWTGVGSLIQPEPWTAEAACTEMDPDLWFPPPTKEKLLLEPKEVCARCTVREQCLEYAMRRHEQWGVWGGLSAHERNAMQARQNARAAADAVRASGVFAAWRADNPTEDAA